METPKILKYLMNRNVILKLTLLVLSSLMWLLIQVGYCQYAQPVQASVLQNRSVKNPVSSRKRKKKKQSTQQRSLPVTVVPPGGWGGEHISLEISENGAQLEFDCAHSTIKQQITLNDKMYFDVEGIYVKESGGPQRPWERPDSHPVRYTGHIAGQTMTITVTLTDSNQKIGTFTLIRGQSPVLVKCL
jgi:hypothetical protein